MVTNTSDLDNFIENDWQFLGKLNLPIDMYTDGMIGEWLSETLKPLKLQVDFIDKVSSSTRQAVHRALLDDKRGAFDHFHLLIYSQKHRSDHSNTWGFFRIEKNEQSPTEKVHAGHAIEIYLYPEGHR